MSDRTITINDIGPIDSVTIPVPEGGGIVVLRGSNGSGKSTAIDAVDALARGGSKLAARARAGKKIGSAEGLGARISVGLRRATRRGELAVDSFDARVDVGRLVDPGIKDPDIADRHRIATACALAGIHPDTDKFKALSDDGIDEDSLIGDDLVEVAARVRSDLNSAALRAEREAMEQHSKSAALREAAGDLPDVVISEADAHAMLEAAIAAQSALRAQDKAASEKIAAGEKARAELARIEVDGDALTAEGAQIAEEIAAGKVAEAETLEKHAAAALAEAVQVSSDAASALREARTVLAAAQRRDKDRAAAHKALEAATSTESAPTDDDIRSASEAVDRAREVVSTALRAKSSEANRRESIEAEVASRASADRSKRLREAAQGTDGVLAEQLAAVMPQGLLVRNGRLAVERDGREVPFGELSDGERWKIALDIAIEAMGGEGIVPIEQGAWEGLDGDARRSIAEHARDRGVLILTAEADHGDVGPLRAEVLESRSADQ